MSSISKDRLSFTASSMIFHPSVRLKKRPNKNRHPRIVFIIRDMDDFVLRDTLEMFTDAKGQRSELLPVESGDSDIALFQVRP